jgi:D-3-phosphoglycerate dehydrogenase
VPHNRRRILALIALPDATVTALSRDYDVAYRPQGWPDVTPEDCLGVTAIVTNGTTGLPAERMASFPTLGLVSAFGAGYENVDIEAAQKRGIVVTHAPGVNDDTVADHAVALTLSVARDIPARDGAMRAGGWAKIRKPRPTITGNTVGILGLGRIGRKIAKRLTGFDVRILYNTPSPKPDCGWTYVGGVIELAMASRFLIVACPGGTATRHLVNAEVLKALGPDGFLVNVARGGIVDTQALIAALSGGGIAGAALDVYEDEPHVPAALLALGNVICTPHMAGRSPEAELAQTDLLLANLRAFFSGGLPISPVP